MPDEFRRLRFSMDEVAASAIDHLLRSGAEMPRGHLTEAAFSGDDRQVMLRFTAEGEPPAAPVPLPREVLAAALMRCCQRKNIPLPRRASKTLEIEGGRVCLVLQMEDGPARAA